MHLAALGGVVLPKPVKKRKKPVKQHADKPLKALSTDG